MINLYLLAKKIHRLLVLLITFLTVVMAGTGILMKYSIAVIDLGMTRYIHNKLSVIFTVTLGLMALTGLLMYLIPYWRSKSAVKPTTEQRPGQS